MLQRLNGLAQARLPSCYGSYQQLALERSERILTIGLNRPEKKNAIGVEMTLEIERVMLACALDREVQVVIFHGLGGNFSAGMDMKDFFDHSDRDPMLIARARRATDNWRARLMRNLPQVRLAVVQGYCLGGAWPILECADIVLCAEDSKFGLPEINFGFVPGGPIAKTVRTCLTRNAGSHSALTGLPFGAAEAVRFGLATRVVADADIFHEALLLARHICTRLTDQARKT